MKKLLFFRSSSSSSGNNNSSSPSDVKHLHREVPSENELNVNGGAKAKNGFQSPKGLFSKSRKAYDNESTNTSPFLRRSRSMSSPAFLDDELDQSRSPCSSIGSVAQQYEPRRRALTPERPVRAKRFELAATQNTRELDRPGSSNSHPDSSGSSSSSDASTKVLDLYIDGEQQIRSKNIALQRNAAGNGNCGGRRPPRVQYIAPRSPIDGMKDRPKSQSFREFKGSRLYSGSRDWVEKEFDPESPRRLARNVVERLSQTHSLNKSSLNHDVPITIEDIYGDRRGDCFDPNLDVPCRKSCSLEKAHETIDNYHGDDYLASQSQRCFNFEDMNSVQTEDAVAVELRKRYKEAEERVLLLSEELEQDSFLRDGGCDFPSLMQTIKQLMEEKLSLAVEVSGLLMSRISERESSKEELNLVKSDLESQIRRLGKEKGELQSALEKELDRRSNDWSLKLNKYKLEEQRLRDRVRELAEQNVSLQREVSALSERETERRTVMTYYEQQVSQLTAKVDEFSKENVDLREKFSEIEKKYSEAEENLSCFKRNIKEKDEECKELQKTVSRLLRTCSEQEKTIDGLRAAFSEEIEKQTVEKSDKNELKFQMEHMRLTGVELSLRRKIESQRIEIDSLRHENICLLNRLKGCGEENGALTFKIDKEIWSRICHLQNQGLPMLKESTHLCSQLLDFIKKEEAGHLSASKQGTIAKRNGLDGQFLIEADVKVQGFKRGLENLARSLQTVSSVLQEKSNLATGEGSEKLNDPTSEETLRYQLKAETLVASLLREKVYSVESEVEQLQAELAAAMRGNNILRREVQNAMDNFSHASHRLKDYELQMQKKDENLNRVQNELEECMKELTLTRGILPKVSGERDLMLEKVNEVNEENVLLNKEIGMLKKKIEALDEDILLKEGQITILKDTLGTRPFDILASGEYAEDFLLK